MMELSKKNFKKLSHAELVQWAEMAIPIVEYWKRECGVLRETIRKLYDLIEDQKKWAGGLSDRIGAIGRALGMTPCDGLDSHDCLVRRIKNIKRGRFGTCN